MRLVYWVCPRLNDSRAYSIREATRAEAAAKRKAWGDGYAESYGPPQRVTVEYRDALDLVRKTLGEEGIEYARPKPRKKQDGR